MRRAPGPRLSAVLAIAALLLSGSGAVAVHRDVARDLRERYEGRTLRLRVDLRPATQALEPNRMTLAGVGYARETAPVLFYRFESVFLERLTSDGATRLSLTVYRDRDEALQMRAVSIPAPVVGNPAGVNTMGAYARGGSTSVSVELKAGKKDRDGQRREADELIGRLFYLSGAPARFELEAFVLEHRTMSVTRLASITGLTPDEVRALTTAPAPATAPGHP